MSSQGRHRKEGRERRADAGEKRPLESVSTRQRHIANMAGKYTQTPLTTLNHHLDLVWLHEAYSRVKRSSSPGVDGVTVEAYGNDLDAKLPDLLERVKSGRYRAPLVKRASHSGQYLNAARCLSGFGRSEQGYTEARESGMACLRGFAGHPYPENSALGCR